jgi:hypothetical protein
MAKPKMTPATQARLVQALELQATRRDACAWAGISYETLRAWMVKDSAISAMVESAEARGRIGLLAKIEQASNAGVWQAAAWKLERRDPDGYGRRDRLELTIRETAEHLASQHGLDAARLIDRAEAIANGKA